MNDSYTYIAVDVSKDTLQIKTASESFVVSTDRASLTKLAKRLSKLPNPLVVCEASGGYERPLLEAMRAGSVSCVLVNAFRIRAFALSEGIRAKNDPIDADIIFKFAQEKKLQPSLSLPAAQQDLADLLDRRSHLSEEIAREKNRLQKAPKLTAPYIKRMLVCLERQLLSIEQTIRTLLKAHPALHSHAQLLTSVQGVGEVTAWTILAYLHELPSLGRNQATALVGIAPFDNDSGSFHGRRRILGGRAKVRRCLYMAAHTAAIHNHVIKPYVQRLLSRGKAYKSAIVAAMRKLLLHLQSLLKSHPFPLAS